MAAFTERSRSGLSQTSSMVTISSINTSFGSKPLRTMKKVHTFAKRDQAIKRDPNSVTVMRGWLHKQDSSGLKLWKRRWFVLSDFCLFYYRDSREERILGSIPMPSYIITAADPQDRKTRKFTFKAEHSGMRTYYFSADTQEDMNGWIRALIHSARVEPEYTSVTSMKAPKRVPQEQRYSSFEDFTNAGLLQDRGNAQSAESLEIAKLSAPMQQVGCRSEMMERKLEKVRQDLLAPTDSHRDDPRLTISLEQLTPPPHNGTVPPSTPTSGVQNSAFRFEGGAKPGVEYVDPQRSSLCNVEQWVRSQKEQLPEEQEDEHHVMNTRSGHLYEYLVDGYPISSVNSHLYGEHSIPIGISSGHMQQNPSYYLNQEQGLQQEAPSPISIYHNRLFPSNTPDLISSRSIRSLRSNSLPITSDTPRYQVLRRSHTPDDRYVILSERQHCHLSQTPSERISLGSLDRIQMAQNSSVTSKPPVAISRSSQRARSPSEKSEPRSHEDISHTTPSQKAGRALMRPHTPVGRIDILPTPELSPVMRSGYLQIPQSFAGPHSLPTNFPLPPTEEQPGEYHIAQGQTLNSPYSRSHQLCVLPSEEHYTFLSNKYHGPFRIQQRSPTPFERMTVVPLEEPDIEGLSVTIPSRRSGNYRPHTPVERLTVLPGKDHHKEMSLSRPRTPGTRGTSSSFTEFPLRPPPSPRPSPNALLSAVKRLSLSSSVNILPVYGQNTLDPIKYTLGPVKMAENEVDVLLTRLCGQDRLLQGLVNEATQLKAEKDKLEGVWEAAHCQMMDFKRHPNIVEQLTFQQRILQEDLIQIRARLCDLSMEIEQSWNEYEFLENELQRFRSSRELLTRYGSPQERGEAQRDVWMIEDMILGLSSNRKSFQDAIGSTQQPEHLSEVQSDSLQTPFGLTPQPSSTSRQSLPHEQVLDDVPCRPPLPQVLHCNHSETVSPPNQSEQKHPQGERNADVQGERNADVQGERNADVQGERNADVQGERNADVQGERNADVQGERNADVQGSPQTSSNYKSQRPLTAEGIRRKGKMSAEEQLERMKRHREAHRQDRPKTSIPPQRGVTVSPRGALTGASKLNSTTLVTNRPVTCHPTGAHLTASVIPSRSRPGITPTAPTKPAPAPEPPYTRNITASSKLVAKLPAPPVRAESQTHEHSRIVRKEYEPSKVVITTRYIDVDPETALSSEQLQEKQRTVEKIKTMIAKTSPGVAESWSPACRSLHPGERERERILHLSYTLATEAAQRRRVLTAKALAEFQEQEEVMDNQTLQSKGSQSKPQENGLVFNFGPERETTNPNSEYRQESANPGAGQNSPRGKNNQYSTKESIPTNQRSTLAIEPANLRLGEQKGSTNLDLSQEVEGMNGSSPRRLLRDISPIVMEGSTNPSLNQE
ncbi:pleckstrin homology domain-containing family A member 7-like isoform X3 [Scyliorhinus torazame]|uniref:pleckstrin homology domain-containing family A member 7-like isoform X3 n=1 Tax=Scyliorhinus torazame TaxID=75743 RepID=UPI003B5CCA59